LNFIKRINRFILMSEAERSVKFPSRLYSSYLRNLKEEINCIPSLFKSSRSENFRLEDLYLPLKLREFFRDSVGDKKNELVMDIEKAVDKYNYILIRGDIGSGKSVLLKGLALKYCFEYEGMVSRNTPEQRGSYKKNNFYFIPIYIKLRKYFESRRKFRDYLDLELERHGFIKAKKYLETDLMEGRCILLLDGLDELPSLLSRDEAIITIRNFIAKYHGNKILITSRMIDYYEDLSGFMKMEIEPFTDDRIKAYLEKRFKNFSQEYADILLGKIYDNPDINELVKNPLLLSIIVTNYTEDENIFCNHFKLYNRMIDLLVWEWEEQKGILSAFSLEQKRYFLQKLAFKNQLSDRRTFQKKEILEELSQNSHQLGIGEDEFRPFFKEIWGRNCMFRRLFMDTFEFLFFSFQVYFTALEIMHQENNFNDITMHIGDPWWEDPIIMYSVIGNNVNSFIKKVLEIPEDIFYSNLIFTGKCIARIRAVEPLLKDDIVQDLWSLYQESEYIFLKKNIIAVLNFIKPRRIIELLVNQLTDKDSSKRRKAASILGHLGSLETLPALIMVLIKDKDCGVRSQAALALGKIGSSESLPALIKSVRSDIDNKVRRSALESIGLIGCIDTIPELLSLLNSEKDSEMRSGVVDALGSFRNPEILEQLIDLFFLEERSSVRWRVALALGKIGGQAAQEILVKALSTDRDREVRESAAESLALIGGAKSISSLITALTKDNEADVRGSAAYALGVLECSEAFPDLIHTLITDRDGEVRGRAAYALGRLKKIEAIPYLSTAFNAYRTSFIRGNATWALGEIGGSDAIAFITEALMLDQDSYVRYRAAEVLGTIGDSTTILPLKNALGDEGNYYGWRVKDIAFESLEKISKRLHRRILKD